MSSDEELFTRIGAYVDGELPAAERDEVESLITSSLLYQRAAKDYQWLDQLAGTDTVPTVSADEWVHVKDGVLRRKERGEPHDEAPRDEGPTIRSLPVRDRWRGIIPLPLAALALFAASLAIAIYSFGPGTNSSASPGNEIKPGQASSDAVQHLEGARPTTIEVDDEGGASRVFYEDF